MNIVNAHLHLFLFQDVPDKFLPLRLVRFLADRDHPILNWFLRNLNPFTDNDILDKYLKFIRIGKDKTQADILQECANNYPTGTRYICLPMDLTYMKAGNIPRDYIDQIDEVAKLPENVIKFFHCDPRRGGLKTLLSYYIEEKNFKGVKIYPNLGYYPFDERLTKIYEYCNQKKLPVISHSSPNGPVYYRGSRLEIEDLLGIDPDNYDHLSDKQLCGLFSKPTNFQPILQKYPDINLCIAHFGSDHWGDYIKGIKKNNWVDSIIELIRIYDNCWTDISFTMSNEQYWPQLRVLLRDNPKLTSRVLYGSDWYVNQTETTEREFSVKLRSFLGEDIFTQIAVFNPKNFLRE